MVLVIAFTNTKQEVVVEAENAVADPVIDSTSESAARLILRFLITVNRIVKEG
jgi:hypothetical protein